MKTLTIKQPLASLIANGIKDIENRTWPTKYRGRILIHAGKDKKLTHLFPTSFMTSEQVQRIMKPDVQYQLLSPKYCIYGSIIGSVEIVDCVINHPSIWAESVDRCGHPFGCDNQCHDGCEWINKPIYNWVLANPILFDTPIPSKGKLSFWDYPNILAEPVEKGGELFCHCQLPVNDKSQVSGDSHFGFYCRYCGGKWYK